MLRICHSVRLSVQKIAFIIVREKNPLYSNTTVRHYLKGLSLIFGQKIIIPLRHKSSKYGICMSPMEYHEIVMW